MDLKNLKAVPNPNRLKIQNKHSKCLGYIDANTHEYKCEYESTIDCFVCKYNGFGGRKNPEVKCNQSK